MELLVTPREKETHMFICRICLKVDILDGVILNSENGHWLELYEYCLGITVHHVEQSNKICNDCADKLRDFEAFKKLARKSEELWHSSSHLLLDNEVKVENFNELNNKDNSEVTNKLFNSGYQCKLSPNEDRVKNDEEQVIFGIDTYINDKIYSESDHDTKEENEHQKQIDPQEIASSKNSQFTCHSCCKIFRKQKSYNEHKQSKRCRNIKRSLSKCLPVAPDFYCGLCDMTLPERNQIIQHITKHNTNNDLCCNLCKFIGRDFADMASHRYNHQRNEYKVQIFCHLCEKKFSSTLVLQFHYRSKHLNVKGGWCSVCNKQFNTYKVFRNHERLHKIDRYICDICGKKFLFRHRIIEHIKDHSEYRGFICDICGKSFKRHYGLKHHLDTTHNDRRVKCHHCNKLFKNQRGLNNHLRYTTNSSYRCDICYKQFAVPSMLKSHMIWHLDERPFTCSECGLSYKVKSQLTIHMRKHTGIMPYKCDLCVRSFPSSNQLKTHISSHTGKRRYKCPHCSRSFHDRKLLLAHSADRHKSVGI